MNSFSNRKLERGKKIEFKSSSLSLFRAVSASDESACSRSNGNMTSIVLSTGSSWKNQVNIMSAAASLKLCRIPFRHPPPSMRLSSSNNIWVVESLKSSPQTMEKKFSSYRKINKTFLTSWRIEKLKNSVSEIIIQMAIQFQVNCDAVGWEMNLICLLFLF